MANPSKQRPWAIEMKQGERWYALDAFRTEGEAKDMLPVFRKRISGVRVRDIRETAPKEIA